MTGERINKTTEKYIRNAKRDGHEVICAVDIDTSYKNVEGVSGFLNPLLLIQRSPCEELAKLFMRGYLLAKGPLADHDEIHEDYMTAIEEVLPTLKDANEHIQSIKKRIEAERERDRETTRIDANKPKVRE